MVGAFVDLGDLGVAHRPLDREVLGAAVTAEQLHRVGGASIATSEAKHVDADEMKPRSGSPRSARAAAVWTISRACARLLAAIAELYKRRQIPVEDGNGRELWRIDPWEVVAAEGGTFTGQAAEGQFATSSAEMATRTGGSGS